MEDIFLDKKQAEKLFAKLIRLEFEIREKGPESVRRETEQKLAAERVTECLNKVAYLSQDVHKLKNEKEIIKRFQGIDLKIERLNQNVHTLQKEIKQQQETFLGQLNYLEKKISQGLEAERSKRASVFSRWVKQHGSDVESLRMALEDGLSLLEHKSKKEFNKQTIFLEELSEKVSVALIRRYGYLPTTTTVQKSYKVAQQDSLTGNTIATKEIHKRLTRPLENTSKRNKKHNSTGEEEDEVAGIFDQHDARMVPLKLDMDQNMQSLPHNSLETLRNMNASYERDDLDDFDLGRGPGQPPVSSFDQGLGAHYVLDNMDLRMDDILAQIEEVKKMRNMQDFGQDIVQSVRSRRSHLRAYNSDDEDYNGEEDIPWSMENNEHEDEKSEQSSKKKKKNTKIKKSDSSSMAGSAASPSSNTSIGSTSTRTSASATSKSKKKPANINFDKSNQMRNSYHGTSERTSPRPDRRDDASSVGSLGSRSSRHSNK